MLLLEVNNLFCSVRNNSITSFLAKKKPILKGVNLFVEHASSLALLGESGGGKTMLAKCLVGLQQPDSGTIAFNGMNIFPHVENREAVGLEIQMLFQGGSVSLDPALTVLDSLVEAITARTKRPLQTRAEAEQLISSVGLPPDCLNRLPRHLSGGQRQRVALARILAVAPQLLILDEPTSALDALTSAQLLQALKSLHARKAFSVLYITHDMRAGFAFCDRAVVLHDGVIVEEGPCSEILRAPKHEYTSRLLKDSNLIHA